MLNVVLSEYIVCPVILQPDSTGTPPPIDSPVKGLQLGAFCP